MSVDQTYLKQLVTALQSYYGPLTRMPSLTHTNLISLHNYSGTERTLS